MLDAIARNLELSAEAVHEHSGRRARGEEEDQEESPVVAAIHADPDLSVRQREALLEVYDSFVGRHRRGRGAPH